MRTELSNDYLTIRKYRSEFAPLVFEAAIESKNELIRWMPWCHPDYSLEESESFASSRDEAWENKTEFDFAVFERESNMFLGGVGLNQFNRSHNFANLGYWVRTGKTGHGVASSAAALVAEFGFIDLNLSRIEIVVTVGNIASERVAEKAGAQREGVLKNRLILHDRPHDATMFSLVAG